MKKAMLNLAAAAILVAAPFGAQATVFQFNATLNQANEVAKPIGFTPSSATGLATLVYNDFGTIADTSDDLYDFGLSVQGLTVVASAFHIHGLANTAQNATVRISLDAAPFLNSKAGGTLLVNGDDIAPPVALIPAGNGHLEMSFLDALRSSLMYVNVHTAPVNPGGEVRGQLIEVAAIPEPETYAMLLAGLGLVGWIGARRRKHTT